jgi:hypothetical protein
MANENPTGPGATERLSTLDDDDRTQASVLKEVLWMYPEPITLAELTREMTVASTEFGEQDRIRAAVRDLIANGLLYKRDDDLVIPTRAAVRFYTLFEL